MAQVKLSLQAMEDLDNICVYFASSSKRHAEFFCDSIIRLAESIGEHPRMGWKVPEYDFDHLRERLFQNYRVIYQIKSDDLIEIASIIHGARRLPALPLA